MHAMTYTSFLERTLADETKFAEELKRYGAVFEYPCFQTTQSWVSVAEVLGVHRTYMGGVERGERNLTLKSMERMAEKLGVEARDLLG